MQACIVDRRRLLAFVQIMGHVKLAHGAALEAKVFGSPLL
jgi:hypothetical protein